MEMSKLKQLHRHIIEVSNELYEYELYELRSEFSTDTECDVLQDVTSAMCSLCAVARYLSQYTLADEMEE